MYQTTEEYKRKLNVALYAILTLLDEIDGGAPEVSVYMSLGCDMAFFQTAKDLLLKTNLATSKYSQLFITPAGREMAGKIKKAAGMK